MAACPGPGPFPAAPYHRLLASVGVQDPSGWIAHWQREPALAGLLTRHHGRGTSLTWGVVLPLLEALRRSAAAGTRPVVGLSGLPGSGKTTLTTHLIELADAVGLRLAVASIDDLYFPGEELERSMAGNPWQAPRALPGSHDVDLLLQQLARWRSGAPLRLPRFDKSLREARGDRTGWWQREADVLLLEGWFLGCRPRGDTELQELLRVGSLSSEHGLDAPESAWLLRTDRKLTDYLPLWQEFESLWLLRPLRPALTRRWKAQQEAGMRRATGRCLSGEDRERFVRMILNGLPDALYHRPLLDDGASSADAVAILSGRRRCLWSGLLADLPDGGLAAGEPAAAQLSSSADSSSIG
ncbi:hypothetical protein EVJ50_05355 [Synechococcus sp. RSCCF101]|uniref:hypothetical protein n=1 Tax=Synechococcus sp. RSCCF101 TaxID=2511069 RepID=UPI001248BE2D|nr:hypothetical protein [Synechococcus sp. RSCCF101]QEY31758.1 hypothetical protein EVJ50_05355 [Synechococcus sp. RSCCF101]